MTFWGHPRTLDRNNFLTGNLGVRATCLVLALGVALLSGSPAEAAISPPGCNTNGVTLNLAQSPSGTITNGQTVTYTITLANGSTPDCDAVNVVIQGFCPDANGIPKTTPAFTNPTIATLGVPTPVFTVGTFSCVVTVNTGVTIATAQDTISGNLQDSNGPDPFSGSKTLSVSLESTPPPPPPPPPPDQIPTLSEWVMIMLAAFLALVGVTALRRKRIA